MRTAAVIGVVLVTAGVPAPSCAQERPAPPGVLVDIGGQRLHLDCAGAGSPTVLLENGTGDYSMIWGLVQPGVSRFTRVCSYDRGGYAWSEPGSRPRTFAQLALELRTALRVRNIEPPYILVGQSYGGLVVRGFAAMYRAEVKGMVLVDAVHEDQRVVYGGQPHRLRDGARGRPAPTPRIALDTAMLRAVHDSAARPVAGPLEPPLDRLPPAAQALWRWADAQPLTALVQQAETDWSPEELAKMHESRIADRATLADLPLAVLARADGGYARGMSIPTDSLEKERRFFQADLAALSRRGTLTYAPRSGHNIHLEDPDLVVRSIHSIVTAARAVR
jgi:pimeloyl-ACP methyl ester carboxylesterase